MISQYFIGRLPISLPDESPIQRNLFSNVVSLNDLPAHVLCRKRFARNSDDVRLVNFKRVRGLDCKNYRPPRPIGVKGGCSPQNNCGNIRRLLNQRPTHDNQAFAGARQRDRDARTQGQQLA